MRAAFDKVKIELIKVQEGVDHEQDIKIATLEKSLEALKEQCG